MTMEEAVFFDTMRQGLWISVQISAPLLTVALVMGVVIGLFQALTQIQESTLTFLPKIVVMILAFSWSASMIGAHVNAFSEQLYARIERGYER